MPTAISYSLFPVWAADYTPANTDQESEGVAALGGSMPAVCAGIGPSDSSVVCALLTLSPGVRDHANSFVGRASTAAARRVRENTNERGDHEASYCARRGDGAGVVCGCGYRSRALPRATTTPAPVVSGPVTRPRRPSPSSRRGTTPASRSRVCATSRPVAVINVSGNINVAPGAAPRRAELRRRRSPSVTTSRRAQARSSAWAASPRIRSAGSQECRAPIDPDEHTVITVNGNITATDADTVLHQKG